MRAFRVYMREEERNTIDARYFFLTNTHHERHEKLDGFCNLELSSRASCIYLQNQLKVSCDSFILRFIHAFMGTITTTKNPRRCLIAKQKTTPNEVDNRPTSLTNIRIEYRNHRPTRKQPLSLIAH